MSQFEIINFWSLGSIELVYLLGFTFFSSNFLEKFLNLFKKLFLFNQFFILWNHAILYTLKLLIQVHELCICGRDWGIILALASILITKFPILGCLGVLKFANLGFINFYKFKKKLKSICLLSQDNSSS